MTWSKERFASDGVFVAGGPSGAVSLTRTAQRRLADPFARGIGPASLVSATDRALQEVLDLCPRVLWDSEEVIRFDLPGARLILVLPEAEMPCPTSLTLLAQHAGPKGPEIAAALVTLVTRLIALRFPTLEPAPNAPLDDPDLWTLLAQPLAQAPHGLPPIDSLVEEVWHAHAARAAPPPPVPAHRPTLWQRLRRFPALQPMRPAVRALAFLLLAMGLIQSPVGQSAVAGTQAEQN